MSLLIVAGSGGTGDRGSTALVDALDPEQRLAELGILFPAEHPDLPWFWAMPSNERAGASRSAVHSASPRASIRVT